MIHISVPILHKLVYHEMPWVPLSLESLLRATGKIEITRQPDFTYFRTCNIQLGILRHLIFASSINIVNIHNLWPLYPSLRSLEFLFP